MIILQVQAINITIAFFKCDSPIAGYRNTPFTLTTTQKPVNTPPRWCISYKVVHALSTLRKGSLRAICVRLFRQNVLQAMGFGIFLAEKIRGLC